MIIVFFLVSFLSCIACAICGIGGGIAGWALNKKMDNRAVDKLFVCLTVLIVGVCVHNGLRSFVEFWGMEGVGNFPDIFFAKLKNL